jgi:nucleoside-diphosphate-sugar epimerase
MRILVVGACGFVGVELCRELMRRGHAIVALEVRRERGRLANVADIEWHVGDCADPEVVMQAIGRKPIDAIYYGPYYRSPSTAKNQHAELRIMGTGALNVFNLARILDVRRIIFPSSTAVHGIQRPGMGNVDEESYVNPFGVYGATKLLGEYWAAEVNAELGTNIVTAVRLPSIYGPGADIASRRVNVFAVQAARGRPGQVNYLPHARVCIAHVGDTAGFLADLIEAPKVAHSVYEIGGLSVTFGEIAEIVTRRIPSAEFVFGDELVSPLPFGIDNLRARTEFGLNHRDLACGIGSIVDYELSRQPALSPAAGVGNVVG